MKTPIDLDALKNSECSEFYWLVSRAVGQTSGVHEVNISTLPTTPAARFNLAQWSSLHPAVTTKDMEAIKAHAHEVAAREEAELKRVTDESRGIARLQQYCNEQGLEETPKNLAAVRAFIDASPVKGYWSEEIVNAAVANLGPRGTNQLTWKPKELPPAPEPERPAESAEVLGTLPNGERQLPLDVPPTNRASKEQARDWLARTREATGEYVRPRGSFGSKF